LITRQSPGDSPSAGAAKGMPQARGRNHTTNHRQTIEISVFFMGKARS